MDDVILNKIRKCVAEALSVNTEDIRSESRLIDDLGADSLDLVELMYMLEQEFGIQLSKKDLSLSAQLNLPEDEVHHNEILTPKALNLLRERFPNSRELLKDGISRNHLAELLTVNEIAQSIAKKIVGISRYE